MSSGEANVTIEVKVDEGSGGKTGQIIVRGQSVCRKLLGKTRKRG